MSSLSLLARMSVHCWQTGEVASDGAKPCTTQRVHLLVAQWTKAGGGIIPTRGQPLYILTISFLNIITTFSNGIAN